MSRFGIVSLLFLSCLLSRAHIDVLAVHRGVTSGLYRRSGSTVESGTTPDSTIRKGVTGLWMICRSWIPECLKSTPSLGLTVSSLVVLKIYDFDTLSFQSTERPLSPSSVERSSDTEPTHRKVRSSRMCTTSSGSLVYGGVKFKRTYMRERFT